MSKLSDDLSPATSLKEEGGGGKMEDWYKCDRSKPLFVGVNIGNLVSTTVVAALLPLSFQPILLGFCSSTNNSWGIIL